MILSQKPKYRAQGSIGASFKVSTWKRPEPKIKLGAGGNAHDVHIARARQFKLAHGLSLQKIKVTKGGKR